VVKGRRQVAISQMRRVERRGITGLLDAIGAALLAAALLSPALHAQAQSAPQASLSATLIVNGRAAPLASSLQVVREIDDPSNGNRWLLFRDRRCPGGPGRLILLSSSSAAAGHAAAPEKQPSAQAPPPTANSFAAYAIAAPAALAAPVIRAGDALIVEENTSIAEARLTATALGAAPVGAPFSARLEIGGKVVRVRALGPGRAAFAPEIGAEP
jgi:hypothetical protein